MTADIARITYDPTRQYRSVVTQQGRVTLEADNNEAAIIASEALRSETIDVVGPAGTPDDGYKPGSGSGAGGVSVGAGTYYLGGWRLRLDNAVDLAKQPDWLDAPTAAVSGNSAVVLLVTEQSICAVEDLTLREVALGGPDSAARTRLMQQFLRLGMDGNTCAAGADRIQTALTADGLTLDAKSLQLVTAARLKAGVVPGPTSTDPCQPTAAGGYLGADNQLVRVTVIAYDSEAQTGTLLWSWNNASLLYRATPNNALTLTLSTTPVDEEHAPQAGQAVEILRCRTDLGDNSFIAAPQGFVTTLSQGYSFDTGQIGLSDALPAEYLADKTPLFVRLWQAKAPFNAGQVTPLDSTSGITVTVTLPALPTQIGLRPFWRFAVRPNTPVVIYPQRYQEAPQPPDGPRQWVTELGVVHANAAGSTLLADCRVPFLPLTEQLGGCCNLVLGPADVAGRGGLQAVMDSLAGTQSSVSLRPGTYQLPAPLVLGTRHAGLTLEGCGAGVILAAHADNLTPFIFGLIVLEQAPDITLRRLVLQQSNIPVGAATAVQQQITIGILAGAAPRLTVEDCVFHLQPTVATFGAGIFLVGDCGGVTVRRNGFSAERYVSGALVFGVLASLVTGNATASIGDADISNNVFQRLPGGVVVFAQFGVVRCTGNRVIGCGTGIYFASANVAGTAEVGRNALTQANANADLVQAVGTGLQASMLSGIIVNTPQFATRIPPPTPVPTVSTAASDVLLRDVSSRGSMAFTSLNAAILSQVAAGAVVASTPASAAATAATFTPAAAAAVADTKATTITGAGIATRAATVTAGAGTTTGATPEAAAVTSATSAATVTTATAVSGNDAMLQAIASVRDVAIQAAVVGITQLPGLHISGNDVVLGVTGGTAGLGIGAVFQPGDATTTVLVSGNRVVTADLRTAAAALLYPAAATVNGNMFVQRGGGDGRGPALLVLTEESAKVAVTGNVVHVSDLILPARGNAGLATNWNFLNTVG
ncbi:MAG TPA: DUF6519 domain-containing protein [Acetobacteraceae bacterium]|nr:DUF6519 domain-containing protein [Acetobacteraceae bacterium]